MTIADAIAAYARAREQSGLAGGSPEDDDLLVHDWRVRQLTRLGLPWPLAQDFAGQVG